MKNLKLLLIGILFPLFSYATVLVDSDFEDGTMGDWVPKMSNECWDVSTSTDLQGSKNLKAKTFSSTIASYVYAYTNVTFDVANYDYEWKCMMTSAISNLSAGNTYWFWLAANKNDFTDSTIKGYVVGINYNGVTDDKLSVWRVNGTSDVTKIIDSDITIGNDTLAIKVTRSSGGVWTLFYNTSNSFDSMTFGGTAIDTSITTGLTTSGPYFISTATNNGKFRFDACTITQTSGSISKPIITSSVGTNVSVYIDEEVTFDITATVSSLSYGGLFSTNKTSGSTFTDKTGDFPLTSTFAWTPDTIGSYSVIFTSTNETGVTTLPVYIEVEEASSYNLWINEFHYDNDGTDANEGVEIAGKAGIDLSNYTIYPYNGKDGKTYKKLSLSGTIPNEDNSGYGAVWFAIAGLQNEDEGIALVKNVPEEVLYFISYSGTVIATDGPASGMTSIDIGIKEGTKDETYSLQLIGDGCKYEDFTWEELIRSPGLINTGQTIKSPTDHGTILIIQ